jgi:hypothetical protein
MTSVEETIEPANEDDEDEQSYGGDIDEMNRPLDTDSDTMSCDSEGRGKEQDNDDEDTDEDDRVIEANDDKDMNDGDGVEIGETIVCGDDDDPKRLTWTRIKDIETDQRTADHEQTFFKNLIIDDRTAELDIFLAFMPLWPEKILSIVREGADKANCSLTWNLDHILAALCIIFGKAQFKENTIYGQ